LDVLLPSVAVEWIAIELLMLVLVEVAVVVPRSGAKSPGTLLFIADPIFFIQLKRMVDFAAANRLPAICNFIEFPKLGGLVGYAPSLPDEFRHAASHIDKILKGAKPAELPVEQPTRFQLVINLKTAKALGLEIPPTLLARADEVIE
jgi:putative tryptophan/tyrosine transport system substrate-binding protein